MAHEWRSQKDTVIKYIDCTTMQGCKELSSKELSSRSSPDILELELRLVSGYEIGQDFKTDFN